MLRQLVLMLFGAVVVVQGFRMIGWQEYHMEFYTYAYAGVVSDFGDQSDGGWMTWGDLHFCLPPTETDAFKLCKCKLKVTTDRNAKHYQIMGGDTRKMDESRQYLRSGGSSWGVTSGQGIVKHEAASGVSWSDNYDSKEYTYVGFYVIENTQPPVTVGLSYQFVSHHFNEMEPEQTQGVTTGSGIEAQHVATFWSYTTDFQLKCSCIMRLYGAVTYLTSTTLKTDQQKQIGEATFTGVKTVVLQNNGCGTEWVDGMMGELSTVEKVTETNRATWSESFSFGFELSYTAGFDVGIVSNEISMSASFGYETSKEFETIKSTESIKSFKWPTYCAPGYECQITIMRGSVEMEIPVEFEFDRQGVSFTETNIVHCHVETLYQRRDSKAIPTNTNC